MASPGGNAPAFNRRGVIEMKRQIVAISGGGFSAQPDAFIDEFIINLRKADRKVNIAFVASASNDAQGYIDKFYTAFQHENPSHLTIADLASNTIQESVNALDILYVGGGSTQDLLGVWRQTGFDDVLKNAYHNGVLLCGISAGAMCWFEHCFTERRDGNYEELEGLGLVEGAFCPHYEDPERKEHFDAWAEQQVTSPIYKLYDNESLYLENGIVRAKLSAK